MGFGMQGTKVAALTAALCAVSAQAREAPATEAEIDQAIRAHIECQIENAFSLDDGTSDAATVGKAVAIACSPSLLKAAEAMAKGSPPQVKRKLTDQLSREAHSEAITFVLKVRSGEFAHLKPDTQSKVSTKAASGFIEKGRDLVSACGGEAVLDCASFAEAITKAFAGGVAFAGGTIPYCLPAPYRRFEVVSDLENLEDEGEDLLDADAGQAIIMFYMRRYECPAEQ